MHVRCNLKKTVILSILLMTGFLTILGSGGYKDHLGRYNQPLTQQKEEKTPPFMFITNNKHSLYFYNFCDSKTITESTGANLVRGVMTVPIQNIRSDFSLYSIRALKNNYVEQDMTDEYVKIERVIVEVPGKNLSIHMFQELQKKLYEQVQNLGGDAVIDLCYYLKDRKQSPSYPNNRHISIVEFVGTMTATVVQLKEGFQPEEKYLVKHVSEK